MKWLLLTLTLLGLNAQAATIYLCKAYNGGTFWSSTHCHKHSALIDRIVSVPDTLPWAQQVQLAEQERSQRAALSSSPAPIQQVPPGDPLPANAGKQAECASLSAQIAQFDALARQPHSGQAQDSISAQRKHARDRQFSLRC